MSGIIVILAALIPFIIHLIDGHLSAAADPVTQNQKRYDQIDQQIAKRDSAAATVGGGDDLDQLERLQNARGDRAG